MIPHISWISLHEYWDYFKCFILRLTESSTFTYKCKFKTHNVISKLHKGTWVFTYFKIKIFLIFYFFNKDPYDYYFVVICSNLTNKSTSKWMHQLSLPMKVIIIHIYLHILWTSKQLSLAYSYYLIINTFMECTIFLCISSGIFLNVKLAKNQ